MKNTIWMVAVLSGLATGCAHQSAAQLPSRPMSSAEREMGYQDAVDLGSTYVANLGHQGAEIHEAEQLSPNLWRLRFGLAPKGSGRFLDLQIDGETRSVVKSAEVSGVGLNQLIPPQPKD